MSLLPQDWYARDVVQVARELLGMRLRRGAVTLRITEVEAYLGPHDSACHTAKGRTTRNRAMWGPPGHAYVYVCYGLHQMLNVVAGVVPGSAVLIRACEPVAGLGLVRRRRGGLNGPALLAGPGRVGAALGLDTGFCGHALFMPGGLELLEGRPPARVAVGRRVGIDNARPRDVRARLRFADADSAWVSHRGKLRP
ncbi:MAG: DNA-3-methyladenine glycosylase [Planctomycetes bacterium]|nr:DNA-3-methyladenine glycosylase [Planctomycetota bacterium]MCL4728979.1 DNA-3-methyladenine glycosylase [Planctomycetota bacterium]